MDKIKVRLLRPLNGWAVGTLAEYPRRHGERLIRLGAVEAAGEKKAPRPANKMAAPPANKSASSTQEK